MRCLNSECKYFKTIVINSRVSEGGEQVRRRRLCPKCGNRYTSSEHLNISENKK